MRVIKERGMPIVRSDVSFPQFLDKFLRPLKPCLMSGLTDDWIAARVWTCQDPAAGNLIPNFPLLKVLFGAETECVTFCDETDRHGELIQRDFPISSFLDSLNPNTSRKTYLKDFHFMRHLRKPPYSVPRFFAGSHPFKRILM